MSNRGKKYCESYKYGQLRLMKRKDSGIWYVKYKDPLRSRQTVRISPYRTKSLNSTLKRDAEKQADHLNAQLLNDSMGLADGSIPLLTLFDKFMKSKSSYTPEGKKRMQSSIKVFSDWLSNIHQSKSTAGELTVDLVRQFQTYRQQMKKAPRTINNDVTNMHTIFKWGIQEKLVSESPFRYHKKGGNLTLLKDPFDKSDVYSEPEYQALVYAADQKGDILLRDLIVTFASTGMRFEELAHLTSKSLCWNDTQPYIEIRARDGWMPKDPSEVKCPPMSPEVQEIMRRRVATANGGYLFQNRAGNKIAANKTREKLQALFQGVGIDSSRRLHWHSWRNYFIIKCVNKNVATSAIMSWVGHDSISMINHYLRVKYRPEAYASEFSKVI